MESDFQRLIAAIRAGDRQTADETVRKVEPYIRAAIHLRMTDSKLRRLFDSLDICQSVLVALFAKGGSGWTGHETTEHIRRKLQAMAINKLRTKARRERRNLGPIPVDWERLDPAPPASQVMADLEMKTIIWERLSEAERWLFDQNRLKGRTWKEIARDTDVLPASLLGGDHDALRMRLARALVRVGQELQHEGARHAQPNIEQRSPEQARSAGTAR